LQTHNSISDDAITNYPGIFAVNQANKLVSTVFQQEIQHLRLRAGSGPPCYRPPQIAQEILSLSMFR